MWSEFRGIGIAKFPYQSSLPNHINLSTGDSLEILEKCGEWVRVKCQSTSTVGICPLNRIALVSDDQSVHDDLLKTEISILFKYIFERILVPTNADKEETSRILVLIRQVLANMPIDPNENSQLARCLDELRQLLGFPEIKRTKRGTLVRTHDVASVFQSQDKTTKDLNYAKTISLTVSFQIKVNATIKISPFLYNMKTKQRVTAPAEFVIATTSDDFYTRIFDNIDANVIDDLALVFRVFEINMYEKFVTADYIGVAAEPIFIKNGKFKPGHDISFSVNFYRPTNGSFVTLHNDILDYVSRVSKEANYVPSEILTMAGVRVSGVETTQQAISDITDEVHVTTLGYPTNLGPQYQSNTIYVHLGHLKQKSKLKNTRITVRVLDVMNSQYLDCIQRADKVLYTTAMQRGFLDMDIDEVVEINFPSEIQNPDFIYLLFEIDRPNPSKNENHLSSFAYHRLIEKDSIAVHDMNGESFQLQLFKPPAEVCFAKDYVNIIVQNNENYPLTITGDPGDLRISIISASTEYANSTEIANLIGRKVPVSNCKPTSLRPGQELTYKAFFTRILKVLAQVATQGDESSEAEEEKAKVKEAADAVILMTEQFEFVEQSRAKFHNAFIDTFLDDIFEPSQPLMARLHDRIMKMLAEKFPAKVDGNDNINMRQQYRALPYFLRVITRSLDLAKRINEKTGNASFADMFDTVFDRLCTMMRSGDVRARMYKKLITLAFPMICSVVMSAFPLDRAIKTAMKFFTAVLLDGQDNFTKYENRVKICEDFTVTELFKQEATREAIMPMLTDCLDLVINKDLIGGAKPSSELVERVLACKELEKKLDATVGNAGATCRDLIKENGLKPYVVDLLLCDEIPDPLKMDMIKCIEYKPKPEELSKVSVMNFAKNTFYTMMLTSSNFSDELRRLTQFIKPIFESGSEEGSNLMVLVLYFASTEIIKDWILHSEDKLGTLLKFISILDKAVGSNPPSHILFATVPAFVKVVSLSKHKEFSFVYDKLLDFIEIVSGFYSHFVAATTTMHIAPIDMHFYNKIYENDLAPIAELLPGLLLTVPEQQRFNENIILPLLHFYIGSSSERVEKNAVDGFCAVMSADVAQTKSTERTAKAVVNALLNLTGTSNLIHLNKLFEDARKIVKGHDAFYEDIMDMVTYMHGLEMYPCEAAHEDERTMVLTHLLDRCRKKNEYDLYPHFSSLLYELHVELNSHVEAAETIMDCYQILPEDDTAEVGESFGFKKEAVRQRRVAMLKRAIELFSQAQFYERAVDAADELRRLAEQTVDYEELADAIELQGKCWADICASERNILNRFYGVKFYGDGFSQHFKDRTFVYRRHGFFDNMQMMNYVQTKFPKAEVSPRPPPADLTGDYVHVFNVKPVFEESFRAEEPPSAVMVRSVNKIKEFTLEVPKRIRIPGDKKYNEIAEYHREITTLKCDRPLQGITRIALVLESVGPQTLTPIECAVIDTNAKSVELMQKASMYWRCIEFGVAYQESAVSSFSMLINGIVNAAVNGGTKLFEELFLDGDLKDNPENVKNAPALRKAFVDQLKAVNFAITVHKAVVTESYVPLHNQIADQFEVVKQGMEAQVGIVDFADRQTGFGMVPKTDAIERFIKAKKN